jgi:hypothetical protein
MFDQGVQIDYAGLSYFPSANIGGSLEMSEFSDAATRIAEAIQRPIIVPETAYPSTRDFKGQFSRWKYAAPGYPLTPEAQQRWIADFLAMCSHHPHIREVYYWSPEWYGEGMWKAFALFDPAGEAKPAWAVFDRAAWPRQPITDGLFLESRGDQLFIVPVRQAKDKMTPAIAGLRKKTSGVTVEHIAMLKAEKLAVGSYDVDLHASLQNNLHLSLRPDAIALDLTKLDALTGQIDPKKQRLVVFVRGEPSAGVTDAIGTFTKRGIRIDLHPLPEDAPLKFGMSGKF